MTLRLENVREEFLKDYEALAKKTNALLSIEQPMMNDFEQLRAYMLQDLEQEQNRAVFERLKDK